MGLEYLCLGEVGEKLRNWSRVEGEGELCVSWILNLIVEMVGVVVGLLSKEVVILKGYEGVVLVVCFNKDGKYCLSCGKDCSLCFWNLYKGIYIKIYNGYVCDVCDVVVLRCE